MAAVQPENRGSESAAPETEGAAEAAVDEQREAAGTASAAEAATTAEASSPEAQTPEEDPAGGPEQALEQDIEELRARAAERDEYLALAQRTQADFENYRKRTAKDVAAAEGRGVAKLVKELLPAMDNLDRALAAAEEHSSEDEAERRVADGIRLVRDELVSALGRSGIEPYSPVGEQFDPEQHEAMAQQPVEGAEPGTIVEVYEPGYRLNGSVLRAARVLVAS
jgi:molecular chaperone GrpE